MTQIPTNSSDKNSQLIRQESELARLPVGASPALSEIIERSLVHIQTSKVLGMRHGIGEHVLCGPDYQLVCIWAEELGLTREEVMERLLDRSQTQTVFGDEFNGTMLSLSLY